jgi:hypothetical protein
MSANSTTKETSKNHDSRGHRASEQKIQILGLDDLSDMYSDQHTAVTTLEALPRALQKRRDVAWALELARDVRAELRTALRHAGR